MPSSSAKQNTKVLLAGLLCTFTPSTLGFTPLLHHSSTRVTSREQRTNHMADNAFLNVNVSSSSSSSLNMAGGRGWGNEDFLSSLGGSDEDRDESKEKYNDFKESREAFDKRQAERMERMNTPEGQKFMQSMNQQRPPQPEGSEGGFFEDMGMGMGGGGGMNMQGPEGSGRFESMMRQASQKMQNTSGMSAGGFDQKLGVPLDDDEDDPYPFGGGRVEGSFE
eukprot:317656_1